jgi:FdhD protein
MKKDDPFDQSDCIRDVRARRISTTDAAEPDKEEPVSVVLEAPVTIDIQDVGTYTLLCTPDDNRALATGFLLSEGLIDSLDDVAVLMECPDDPSVIRVRLTRKDPRAEESKRNLLIVSSCGLCGIEALDEKLRALRPVGDTFRVDSRILQRVKIRLRAHQPLFEASGGTHAADIFTASGQIVASAEDAGRHNALDKAIGRCLMTDRSPAGCGVMLSGRVSLEMVVKSARAGIEIISAVSAPTSLAIEVAQRCGITLCAFVRETRATVFTHPVRVAAHPAVARGSDED